MKFKKLAGVWALLLGVGVLTFSGKGFADSTVQLFSITGLVSDATQYNGCLIKISPGPQTIFPGCTAGLVTLGCDGAAGPSKTAAATNWSAAQLAFVTSTKSYIRIYDVAPEGNPYCLADRVDNTKFPQ